MQAGKSGQAGRQVSLASLANVLSPGLSPELIPVVVIYKIGIQGAALRCLTLQLIMLYSDNLHYDRHTYTTHVTVCVSVCPCSYIWHICLWPRLMLMALPRPSPRPKPQLVLWLCLLHCSVWGAAYPHAAAACQRHVDARRIKLDFYCHRYYID